MLTLESRGGACVTCPLNSFGQYGERALAKDKHVFAVMCTLQCWSMQKKYYSSAGRAAAGTAASQLGSISPFRGPTSANSTRGPSPHLQWHLESGCNGRLASQPVSDTLQPTFKVQSPQPHTTLHASCAQHGSGPGFQWPIGRTCLEEGMQQSSRVRGCNLRSDACKTLTVSKPPSHATGRRNVYRMHAASDGRERERVQESRLSCFRRGTRQSSRSKPEWAKTRAPPGAMERTTCSQRVYKTNNK